MDNHLSYINDSSIFELFDIDVIEKQDKSVDKHSKDVISTNRFQSIDKQRIDEQNELNSLVCITSEEVKLAGNEISKKCSDNVVHLFSKINLLN
jgi:hypothetical protein